MDGEKIKPVGDFLRLCQCFVFSAVILHCRLDNMKGNYLGYMNPGSLIPKDSVAEQLYERTVSKPAILIHVKKTLSKQRWWYDAVIVHSKTETVMEHIKWFH